MAQKKLTEDMNFVQKAPLEITNFDGDMNIIAKLDDEPNDVGGLTSAELKAEFDKAGNTIKTYINDTLIPQIVADDATEAARGAAEKSREEAESKRVAADEKRTQAEALREQAESQRELAEAARAKSEEGRIQAESGRVDGENTRTDAEISRATAEADRVKAEAARVHVESERVAAEDARNLAEIVRSETEKTRQGQESGRVTAEAQRQQSEQTRVSAETDRADAESMRVSAEKGREAAEKGRVVAEEARTNQETGYVAQARGAAGEAEHWAQEARNASDVVYVGQGSAPTNSKLQIDLSGARRIAIPEVLDTTGDSVVDTMSQRAITDALQNGRVPDGGTEGQVLTQTATGTPAWKQPSGGGGGGTQPPYIIDLADIQYTAPPDEKFFETEVQNPVAVASLLKSAFEAYSVGRNVFLKSGSVLGPLQSIERLADPTQTGEAFSTIFQITQGYRGTHLVALVSESEGTEALAGITVARLQISGGADRGTVPIADGRGGVEWKLPSGAGDAITVPTTLTVGAGGDHTTLNEAIGVISAKYPIYKAGGLKVEVKILAGTTVNEQVSVVQNDLQFITITAEDAEVPVDSTGWTTQGLDAHDLRDDVAFFGGENAAKLPTIGCKFKLVTKGATPAVGYFANRGSSGVILAGCGFDGFHDGIIANNESSVTAREALCTHMDRWGIHARHNGEISARSIDLTHSGVYAAYADRIADIDIRYATLSKSGCAIYANNCSRINANGAVAYYCVGTLDKGLVCAASVSTVNADKMDVQFTAQGTVFTVKDGSAVNAIGAGTPALKPEAPRRSQEANALTVNGVIYDDAV